MRKLFSYSRAWAWLAALLACLLSLPVAAQNLQPELQPLQISILEDGSTQMSLEQVRASPKWVAVPEIPRIGFSSSAYWFEFVVRVPQDAPQDWRLEVANTLIDDVRFFQQGGQGPWLEQREGYASLHGEWLRATRNPVFKVQLAPGTHTVYVRLQGYSTLSSAITFHAATQFEQHAAREALLMGAFLGGYVLVLLLMLYFWLITRNPRAIWFFFYAVVLLVGQVIGAGYFRTRTGMSSVVFQGLYFCLAPVFVVKVSAVWLSLHRHLPRLGRLYVLIASAAALMTSGLVLIGQHRLGVQISQALTLVWLAVAFALALWLRGRKVWQADYYLLIFGLLNVGIVTRFLRNLGLLPVNFWTEYAANVGTTLHLLAMSMYFIHRFGQLQQSLRVERLVHEEQRDFVSMVSHEFRTPLAIIHTSIQQLVGNLYGPVEKTQQRVENIRNAVKRMTHLMDDYLSLDRLDSAQQTIQLQICRLFDVVEAAASEWPTGRIRVQVHDLPVNFVCDPGLLQILLNNLLANADRHAPAGTVIELEASCTPFGTLHLRVQDHGAGIPADEIPRLFQKYVRGRNAQGQPGAGLGLYLVQRIAQAHGGRVDLQTTQGVGTVFMVEIPPGARDR